VPHYDPPSGRYTSKIPSGTQSFRQLVANKFGYTRTEVIRDRSRCNQTRSEHCECRGIDLFTTDVNKGWNTFYWCIENADRYGIQSVIFRDGQWGFGRWSVYPRTKRDHYDHVHVGLNLKGAGTVVDEEDELTPEEKQKLDEAWTASHVRVTDRQSGQRVTLALDEFVIDQLKPEPQRRYVL
jgi:hypothetical protein